LGVEILGSGGISEAAYLGFRVMSREIWIPAEEVKEIASTNTYCY
jgi:hypothetical protein